MGELLLCDGTLAAMPYYIENGSLNVYSLEELCYYMEQNTYLLDADFMNEELCIWIEQEAGYAELAKRLRAIKNGAGTLKDFVFAIEKETGYASDKQLQRMNEEFVETADKSDFECQKIRIDRMLQKKKYEAAVSAYRKLLASEGTPSGELLGNIWHNLGTAYARLFLFEEAKACYRTAYEWNQNRESLRAYLMTFRCMRDENGFLQTAEGNCLSEEEIQELKEEMARISTEEEVAIFGQELEELFHKKNMGMTQEFEDKFWHIVNDWKREYRRICRK